MNPASSSALIAHGGSGEQPQRSLNRQLVLEEDEYTEALSRIIARDFFPSLVQLEANNDYLDALQSNNPTLIEASVRRLSAIQATPTPYTARDAPTPFGGSVMDTPTNEHRRKRRKYNENLSLDEFQAKYTSEDNSSFTEILNDENERRRRTYSWAWEAEKKAQTQHQLQIEAKQTLLIDRSAAPGVRETLRIELPKSAGLITQGEGPEEEDNKNAEDEGGESPDTSEKAVVLLGTGKYGDSEENAVNVLAKSRDTRPTGVDTWNFRNRNNLMFLPDADESPYTRRLEPALDTKEITHSNTRLPDQDEDDKSEFEPPTPSRSIIGAAIAGQPYRPGPPQIGGFSLVPKMPSPTAEQLGSKALKELMTVGQITATPRVLASDGDPLPPPDTPFHIRDSSQREQLGRRLGVKASRAMKERAAIMNGTPRSTNSMPPPSWTPRAAAGNLTPAAKRLLERTVGGSVAGNRRADAIDQTAGWQARGTRDLSKVSWTPTPKR